MWTPGIHENQLGTPTDLIIRSKHTYVYFRVPSNTSLSFWNPFGFHQQEYLRNVGSDDSEIDRATSKWCFDKHHSIIEFVRACIIMTCYLNGAFINLEQELKWLCLRHVTINIVTRTCKAQCSIKYVILKFISTGVI